MATTVRSNDSLGMTPSRPLEDVIAEYLQAVETNPALDRDSFIRKHPAWSNELREFIDSHDQVSRFVVSLLDSGLDQQSANVAENLPRQVGDYQLLEVLGRGGMGVVYKARQISLDRHVALKMLGRDHDPGRFQGEAEAAASLDHPNIVAIYEIGQHEGSPFYSMKLMEAGDLRRLLANGPLPPEQAAKIAAKIAGAVEFAHQRGILHRDLKPGNVLIDGQGEPFVADFGLARRVIDAAQRTDTGAVLGTPSYMAPEQADDSKKAVTTSIDVYGLGALLYAKLTGRPPFEGTHPLQVIRQVVDAVPQPPRSIQPSVPRDLEMICLKSLEKRPTDRYHSAFDLQQDLLRFARGEPVVARPLDWWGRLWRRCRRNPIASSLGLTLVVLLFAAAIGGSALAWREYQARRFAVESGIRERDARRQAVTRLIDSYMNNGRQAQRLSRQAEALPWYANAAELADETPQATDALVRVCRRQRFVPQPVRAAFLAGGQPFGISFHPSGRYLSCHDGRSKFYLWDLATLETPFAIPDVDEVSAYAWNKPGKLLAIGSQAGQLKVMDVTNGQLRLEHGLPEAVRAVCFNSNGQWIAAASGKELEIISLPAAPSTSQLAAEIRKCELPNEVSYLEFNQAATRLMACAVDGSTYVVDSQPGATPLKPLFERAIHLPPTNDLGTTMRPFFVADDRIAVYRDRTLRILDATTGSELKSIEVASGIVWAYEPNRQTLAIGDYRQTRVWSLADGRILRRLSHREPVTALCFHPKGDLLATGSLDGRVNIRDLTSDRMLADLQHQSQVVAMQFSPSGDSVATAQRDGLIRVWKVKPDSVKRVSIPIPHPMIQGKLLNLGEIGVWRTLPPPPNSYRRSIAFLRSRGRRVRRFHSRVDCAMPVCLELETVSSWPFPNRTHA